MIPALTDPSLVQVDTGDSSPRARLLTHEYLQYVKVEDSGQSGLQSVISSEAVG